MQTPPDWEDNGASMEGTVTGSFNEMTFLNGIVLDADQQLELIDQYGGIEAIGSDHTAPHVAAAWAQAMNAPFQWGKQMASHLGGTRDPMAVAWPARIGLNSGVLRPGASPSRRFVEGLLQYNEAALAGNATVLGSRPEHWQYLLQGSTA